MQTSTTQSFIWLAVLSLCASSKQYAHMAVTKPPFGGHRCRFIAPPQVPNLFQPLRRFKSPSSQPPVMFAEWTGGHNQYALETSIAKFSILPLLARLLLPQRNRTRNNKNNNQQHLFLPFSAIFQRNMSSHNIPVAYQMQGERDLDELEAKHDISIVYAAEVGLRAMAIFPSSTFNLTSSPPLELRHEIRFAFIRNDPNAYNWHNVRKFYNNTIIFESRSHNQRELVGHDLTVLMQRATTASWNDLMFIYSPMVYRCDARFSFAEHMRQLVEQEESPKMANILLGLSVELNTLLSYVHSSDNSDDQVLAVAYAQAICQAASIRWIVLNHILSPRDARKVPLIEMNMTRVIGELRGIQLAGDDEQQQLYDALLDLLRFDVSPQQRHAFHRLPRDARIDKWLAESWQIGSEAFDMARKAEDEQPPQPRQQLQQARAASILQSMMETRFGASAKK